MALTDAPIDSVNTPAQETELGQPTETTTNVINQESAISEFTDKIMRNLPNQDRVKSSFLKVFMPHSGTTSSLCIDEHNKEFIQELYTCLLIQSAFSMFFTEFGVEDLIWDWLLLVIHFFLSKKLGRFDMNLSSI